MTKHCVNCCEEFIGTSTKIARDILVDPHYVQDESTSFSKQQKWKNRPIVKVLSDIYNLEYLDSLTNSKSSLPKNTEEENDIVMCNVCAYLLTNLNRFYGEIHRRRRRDSFLAQKIERLDMVVKQQVQSMRTQQAQAKDRTTSKKRSAEVDKNINNIEPKKMCGVPPLDHAVIGSQTSSIMERKKHQQSLQQFQPESKTTTVGSHDGGTIKLGPVTKTYLKNNKSDTIVMIKSISRGPIEIQSLSSASDPLLVSNPIVLDNISCTASPEDESQVDNFELTMTPSNSTSNRKEPSSSVQGENSSMQEIEADDPTKIPMEDDDDEDDPSTTSCVIVDNNLMTFKCPRCQISFENANEVCDHINNQHVARGQTTCPIPSCKKMCRDGPSLRQHIRVHYNRNQTNRIQEKIRPCRVVLRNDFLTKTLQNSGTQSGESKSVVISLTPRPVNLVQQQQQKKSVEIPNSAVTIDTQTETPEVEEIEIKIERDPLLLDNPIGFIGSNHRQHLYTAAEDFKYSMDCQTDSSVSWDVKENSLDETDSEQNDDDDDATLPNNCYVDKLPVKRTREFRSSDETDLALLRLVKEVVPWQGKSSRRWETIRDRWGIGSTVKSIQNVFNCLVKSFRQGEVLRRQRQGTDQIYDAKVKLLTDLIMEMDSYKLLKAKGIKATTQKLHSAILP